MKDHPQRDEGVVGACQLKNVQTIDIVVDSKREESRITKVNLITNSKVSTKYTLHDSHGLKFFFRSKSSNKVSDDESDGEDNECLEGIENNLIGVEDKERKDEESCSNNYQNKVDDCQNKISNGHHARRKVEESSNAR